MNDKPLECNATDCISEGHNLQDCDYLINYDIHWNPVRIIQRFGRILITVAFIVPPTGVIDPSVLAAFGEILTFAGCMLGMDYHNKAKFTAHSDRNCNEPTQ